MQSTNFIVTSCYYEKLKKFTFQIHFCSSKRYKDEQSAVNAGNKTAEQINKLFNAINKKI